MVDAHDQRRARSAPAGLVALLLFALAAPASAAERRALLVSNQRGRADQPALRYAARDVDRMAAVLTELGGYAPRELTPLSNRSADELLATLEQASTRAEPLEVLSVYYSGHGDAAGLWMGESYLPLARLLEAARAVPARLRLIVIDACQSGAAIEHKGVAVVPAVQVQVSPSSARGEVLITSSSSDEASYESAQGQGAVFTLQWVTGLRGPADLDGDGVVRLSEAFRYAQARTLNETLLVSAGPQRPSFRWDVQGQAEPVLTEVGQRSALVVRSDSPGAVLVFDELEERLVAEAPVDRGAVRLALRPATYVVKLRSSSALKTARVSVAEDKEGVLDASRMPATPLVRLASKGSVGETSLALSVGPSYLSVGFMLMARALLGVELVRRWLAICIEGVGMFGSHNYIGTKTQIGVGLSIAALGGVSLGAATIRVGPVLGAFGLFQEVSGRAPRAGFVGSAGGRARLQVELSPVLSFLTGLEVNVLLTRVDGALSFEWLPQILLGLKVVIS